MNLALAIVRVVLAGVFVIAALGKLSDRAAARQAVAQFGLPARLAGPIAVAVPAAELAIAAGLLFRVSAPVAAIAAGMMLLAFSIGMVRLLARGETGDCHCFGSVGASTIGRGTLARNLLLLGGAGFVAVAGWHGGGISVTSWIAHADATACVLIVGLAILAAFSWQLFRQNARLLVRIEALEAGAGPPARAAASRGELAPTFSLPDLDGRLVTLEHLLAEGRGVLLFFTDPGCGHCDPLLPVLARHHGGPQLAVISRGSIQANRDKAGAHRLTPVLLQEDFEVADAYGVFGLPGAVLIDPAGRIASRVAAGGEDVLALVGSDSQPSALVEVSHVA
jgi:peroxiredoxin